MKKIFTLISMALIAMSVNAQEHEPGLYVAKNIVWGDITWKNGNNKKDKDLNDMFFLMGTGNGYATLMAEYFYSESQGDYFTRPAYTYIKYEEGETGTPGYGLYYKFTPKANGQLKFNTWVNKGDRKTFIVKASTGLPMTPYVDYTFDGYVNGQNEKIEDVDHPKYFTADEIKARHDDYAAEQEAAGKTLSPYVIEKGNQAVWGWITMNLEAGESYYIYQQSSQLGFAGYEFTPTGGTTETYSTCYKDGDDIKIAAEFAAVVDATGKATNVTDRGSVVNLGTSNMDVEAVGGAVPTSVEADFNQPVTGIESIKADVSNNSNVPIHNLSGQKVDKSYKGIVIQNGRKFMNK